MSLLWSCDDKCKLYCGVWLSSGEWNCKDPRSLGIFSHLEKKKIPHFRGDELGSLHEQCLRSTSRLAVCATLSAQLAPYGMEPLREASLLGSTQSYGRPHALVEVASAIPEASPPETPPIVGLGSAALLLLPSLLLRAL